MFVFVQPPLACTLICLPSLGRPVAALQLHPFLGSTTAMTQSISTPINFRSATIADCVTATTQSRYPHGASRHPIKRNCSEGGHSSGHGSVRPAELPDPDMFVFVQVCKRYPLSKVKSSNDYFRVLPCPRVLFGVVRDCASVPWSLMFLRSTIG